jgi:hypothetical protein
LAEILGRSLTWNRSLSPIAHHMDHPNRLPVRKRGAGGVSAGAAAALHKDVLDRNKIRKLRTDFGAENVGFTKVGLELPSVPWRWRTVASTFRWSILSMYCP